MNKKSIIVAGLTLFAFTSAHAMSAKYRKQLERSGCTQVSELQGCEITKTKAENAKAGFVSPAPNEQETVASQTPYAGEWIAKTASGVTVASIRIDAKEQVLLNGKKVKAKRSDGALVFKSGQITYTIQGDRRLKDEDYWSDRKAGTKGPISAK
ncbi:MAG: hypothetical protein ABL931_05050 [Usitatibacteraceae bacterium]